jgi:cyclase
MALLKTQPTLNMKNALAFSLSKSRIITGVIAACLCAASSRGDTANTRERSTARIAEGVYFIRHPDAPDQFPQGNTTVIIGERECLVVDSCLLPSSAKEDIAQIRQWTKKPVRYLVNTHWHLDHNTGNGVYVQAFPNVAIIAHRETAKMIQSYNPMVTSTYPSRKERLQRYIENGKNEEGKVFSEDEKRELAEAIKNNDKVSAEVKDVAWPPLNLILDGELIIDLGNREVQLKFLGRGNTAGDLVIFLPKEKIAIVGDLLDHPVPYFYGGFPSELSATLRAIGRLEPQVIVPGHGEVLYDQNYLKMVMEFTDEIVGVIQRRVNSTRDNEEEVADFVRKNVDLEAWTKRFAGDDKENRIAFESTVKSLLSVAYKEAKMR